MGGDRSTYTGTYAEPDYLPHLIFGALLFCGMMLAWPGLLCGLLLRMLMGSAPTRRWWLWVVAAAVGLWWGLRMLRPTLLKVRFEEVEHVLLRHDWQAIIPQLLPFWLASLALAPLIAGMLVLRRQTPAEQTILATNERQKTSAERRMRQAIRHALHAPSSLATSLDAGAVSGIRWGRKLVRVLGGWDEARRKVVLGCVFDGDLAPPRSEWRTHGFGSSWLVLPDHELRLPGVIVGGSGSGKTETALRLATEAAGALGWQVIYLDAKGDYATAARFLAAMRMTGTRRIAMFPVSSYDGWRGDGPAILNRLLATQDFTEEYYQAVAKQLLYLAINMPGAGGPPRTANELLRRLELETLREAYRGRPEARKLVGIDPKQAYGALARYDGFFSALCGRLDGDWAFEDVDVAFVLLDGLALKDDAAGLGRYVIEDFAHYVVKRKEIGRQTLLIIDEFSALSLQTDAASLSERLRSYGATVFVSSQSYAGLGVNADRILDAANVLIVHRTSDPRHLVERAGVARQVEASHVTLGEEMTGRATLRSQDQLKVGPDAVRQLEPGEAFVIAHGRAARVAVARAGVEATAVEAMRVELEALGQVAHHTAAEHDSENETDAVPRLPDALPVPPANRAAGEPSLAVAEDGRAEGSAPGPLMPRRKSRTRRRPTSRPLARLSTSPEAVQSTPYDPAEERQPDGRSDNGSAFNEDEAPDL